MELHTSEYQKKKNSLKKKIHDCLLQILSQTNNYSDLHQSYWEKMKHIQNCL